MKNLKLTVAFLFLLMISTYKVNAQSAFNDAEFEKSTELRNDIKALSLSSEQEVAFKEVIKKYVVQYENVLESNASENERLEKISQFKNQRNTEMKAALTAEQYVKYIKIQEDRELALTTRHKG